MTSTFKLFFSGIFSHSKNLKNPKSSTPYLLHVYFYYKLNKELIGVHYWNFRRALKNCENQSQKHCIYDKILKFFWL